METIRLSGVIRESIVDGPGIRFVVFTQGCPHKCPGCHNPETHDVQGGYEAKIENIIKEIDKNPLLKGVTISGGEPFLQADRVAEISRLVKERGLDVVVYTGYIFEELLEKANETNKWAEIIKTADYIIDGPYIERQRTLMVPFRGSKNQRYIDVKKSLEEGSTVIVEPEIDN